MPNRPTGVAPSSPNTGARPRISRGFLIFFFPLLIISAALWLFYRFLLHDDSHLFGLLLITVTTAGFWAYLIGSPKDR